jgi:hypothetical protein
VAAMLDRPLILFRARCWSVNKLQTWSAQ